MLTVIEAIISIVINKTVFSDYLHYNDTIDDIYDDDIDENEYLDDAITDSNALWELDPGTGTVPIPFMIDKSFNGDSEMLDKIHRAIFEFTSKTCIR